MKVFIACLSLVALASASLEPAGYRPPGSASSQYLPPHLDHDQSHQHHHQHQQQQQHLSPAADTASLPPASQYLPLSYSRPSTPSAGFASQYLPPPQPRPLAQQRPAVPSGSYLPPADKPSNEYLPPPAPTPAAKPASEYLPPTPRPTAGYLPPTPRPTAGYLPPSSAAPAGEYLPPTPASQYLPAAVRSGPAAPTTPAPRISVVSVAPYKLDGPAYAPPKQQQQQQQAPTQRPRPQYSSASAAPASAPGYPKQPAYPAEVKSYEQPADNYLPPLAGPSKAGDGYRYGAAAAAGSAASSEENAEPAKYDFEYRVSDEFGNDFGHQESRSGEQTHGVYSVLLPDGRKQIVRYQADEHGFKPRITYEEAASVLGPKAAGLASDGYDGNGLGPY